MLGWAVLGELRYDLPPLLTPLIRSQIYGYVDHGEVNRVNPALSTPRQLAGTSIGAGVRLVGLESFSADLQAAKPVEGNFGRDWRYFLILTARY